MLVNILKWLTTTSCHTKELSRLVETELSSKTNQSFNRKEAFLSWEAITIGPISLLFPLRRQCFSNSVHKLSVSGMKLGNRILIPSFSSNFSFRTVEMKSGEFLFFNHHIILL
jgi:hypothetical protein